MSSVRIEHLSKHFGSQTVLDDISLNVGEDELLVILGPTGAGKTTLLRCLAGLETPTSGHIFFTDRDAAALSPAERDVALVFQNFSLYPEWSVRQNMAFPLKAPGRSLDAAAITERVLWAAKILNLEALLDRPAAKLSGGQMQRVAIGRAIVRKPSLFLFDEPLTNLDAKLREQLRVELAVLRRALRIPMIYVTHDQAEALSMGDRIVVLDQGRILQTGTPEAIYTQPRTPTVARLLGQPRMNITTATCDANGAWRTPSGLALTTLGITQLPAGSADQITIGIRPEHLHFNTEESTPPSATVTHIEHLGPVRIVSMLWHDWPIHAVVEKYRSVTRGQKVSVRADAAHWHVWPAH